MSYRDLPYPEGIFFDWDNTLVDTWPVIADVLNLVRKTYGLETWPVQEARMKAARSLRESFPEWFGDQWEKARDIFYERYAAIHTQRIAPLAGAEELLTFLQERNIPAFIISNKKQSLLCEEISHLGWGRFFQAIIGAGESARDKPAPDPIHLAIKKANLLKPMAVNWFVGDTHVDVECALRAGITPILLHDRKAAEQFGLKGFFSDCHTMKTALYNWSS